MKMGMVVALLAGPAWAQPLTATSSAAASSTTTPGGPRIETVALHLDSSALGAAFFREYGPPPSRFEDPALLPLCAAPCTVELLPGPYVLAMSIGDRAPVRSDAPLQVEGVSLDVVGTYTDRRAVRIGGVVLASASVLGAAIGTIVIHENPSGVDCGPGLACIDVVEVDGAALAAVVVSGVIGAIGGLLLSQIPDSLDIDVR